MTPILLRKFSFAEKLAGHEGSVVSASMGEGSITVPGATAFLEWKFINNAGLDNKKNSPAVSHIQRPCNITQISEKHKLLDTSEDFLFSLASGFLTQDNGSSWQQNGSFLTVGTRGLRLSGSWRWNNDGTPRQGAQRLLFGSPRRYMQQTLNNNMSEN